MEPVLAPFRGLARLWGILWGHLLHFAAHMPELYTDPRDGTLSHTRIGMIIAGAVFVRHMIIHQPQGWEIWLAFMGSVGGYAIGRQLVASKKGAADAPPP